MNDSSTNGFRGEDRERLEQQFLPVFGENCEWGRANENRLLAEHPEYNGKYAIIASRCANPVLAVDQDPEVAYQNALGSIELQLLAARANLPPSLFLLTLPLGEQ